ncbi:MAG: ATP-grasp domain-containing protein [Myxococcaceae bacterium]
MRIGIFGAPEDPQCQAVAHEAGVLGAEAVLIDSEALDDGVPLSFEDGRAVYRGDCLDDLRGFYLRYTPSTTPPTVEHEGELVLFEDWFTSYMHQRERSSLYLAWLLSLQHSGAALVNPPHAGSVYQFKPFQLDALRALGARVPRTLISNDPAAVRAFHLKHRDVIFKPVLGGAITRALDEEALANLEQVTTSPVIFQERIDGDDLRIMLAGDEIVSSVAIRTPQQQLDFRADPVYSAGDAGYEEVTLPAEVAAFCRKAARACGLSFAGIDIKRTPTEWVFLELNSSPIYLDVEVKLGHPITRALAKLVVDGARAAGGR